MIRTVNCVYRLSERAEMLPATFDVKQGCIVGAEDMFRVDMSNYVYYSENYSNAQMDSIKRLSTVMCKNKDTLAVIGYNNIGAILVTRNDSYLVPFETGTIKSNSLYPLIVPYTKEVVKVGIVKMPLLTLSAIQVQALLIAEKTPLGFVAHTRFGRKKILFEFDNTNVFCMQRHMELCKDEQAYASYEIGGTIKFAYIKQSFLVSE